MLPAGYRGRPASSRSHAETACGSRRASRRRAARAWLALIVFGGAARPGVVAEGDVGGSEGVSRRPCRSASYASDIARQEATPCRGPCLLHCVQLPNLRLDRRAIDLATTATPMRGARDAKPRAPR